MLGKGRADRVRLTLPGPTRDAIERSLAVRGTDPGPLFVNRDHARKNGARLTGTSVYRIVRDLGRENDLKVRPHGLRHAAVTTALYLTGDLPAVQRFSRHRDVSVLTRYDDNREDLGAKVAQLVAASAFL